MKVDLISNDLDKYFDLSASKSVGEGSYGVVTKCKRKSTNQIVAIKFIKRYNDDKRKNKKGLRIDIYREIQILSTLYDEELRYDHTSNRIAKLQSLLIGSMRDSQFTLGLVFEYYPLCLSAMIRHHRHSREPFETQFIARLMFQLCEGISALHSKWILHRDLKPSNVLISLSRGGCVKLCDFGLSKLFGQRYQSDGVHRQQCDGEIVTLYYRAPELFLTEAATDANAFHEQPALDIWSIGCIIAELMKLSPLFKIDIQKFKANEVRNKEVLRVICFVLGLPGSSGRLGGDEEGYDGEEDLSENRTWDGVEKLCYYNDHIFAWQSKYAWTGCLAHSLRVKGGEEESEEEQREYEMMYRLVKAVLMMDPNKRPTVQQVMAHKFFKLTGKRGDQRDLRLFPDGQCPYKII